jgi:hypothetical protein
MTDSAVSHCQGREDSSSSGRVVGSQRGQMVSPQANHQTQSISSSSISSDRQRTLPRRQRM